jgi:hypothetical protein
MKALILQFQKVAPLCFIVFGLGCATFLPETRAAEPAAPDTALANGNTADGQNALSGLTTGFFNSAFGAYSLLSNGAANYNTGVGAWVLISNTGSENTAVGAAALLSNTNGSGNTAHGTFALIKNQAANNNTAVGDSALLNNDKSSAGLGNANTAVGAGALQNNVNGDSNTAVGYGASSNNVDSELNTVVGFAAGENLVNGYGGNIYIGAGAGGSGDEVRFIRIGESYDRDYDTYIAGIYDRVVDASAILVYADANQKLGTLLGDANGNKVSFKPQAILEESLKQQKKIAELEATVERQQKGMEALTAQLKEQAAQIQKVSAQVEATEVLPKIVLNNP